MEPGDKLLYQGELYKVMYIYKTGYCELKKEGGSLQFDLIRKDKLNEVRKPLYGYPFVNFFRERSGQDGN